MAENGIRTGEGVRQADLAVHSKIVGMVCGERSESGMGGGAGEEDEFEGPGEFG
jgi:hypothetical protein